MTAEITFRGRAAPPLQQEETPRRLSFCETLRERTVRCARKLGLGAAAGVVMAPISRGLIYLGQKAGMLPSLADRAGLLREGLGKMPFRLDAEAIANAACPIQEYAQQLSKASGTLFTAGSIKAQFIGSLGIAGPIFEEVIHRGLIQDLCMDRLGGLALRLQGNAPSLTVQKILRIALSAGVFALMHLANQETMAASYAQNQVAASFLRGLIYSTLKESDLGLAGAIGAHMANNFIAMTHHLISC